MPDWLSQLGVMQWPLAACAIIALTICLERIIFTVKLFKHQKQQYQVLADYAVENQSVPKSLRDEMLAVKLAALQPALFQGLTLLRMIGTMAPMLGLLGTIIGIIDAFKTIAVHAGPVTPNLIANGLWEAMLTTAAGLIIALPILFLAYVFRHMSEQYLKHLCNQLNQLSVELALLKAGETHGQHNHQHKEWQAA